MMLPPRRYIAADAASRHAHAVADAAVTSPYLPLCRCRHVDTPPDVYADAYAVIDIDADISCAYSCYFFTL